MTEKTKKLILIVLVLVIIIPIAYQRIQRAFIAQMTQKMMSMPPVVEVSTIQSKEIYTTVQSAGRIEAKYFVDVVARINGWLQKSYFQEGAFVRKGQVLFLIEPNEYAIAVQNAQAALRQSQAALVNSEKELKRAEELVKSDYVSKSYYDTALANRDQNKAMLDVHRSNLAKAQLNLSYTRIISPIDGKIGKILITQGNLVNAQAGVIATIVSVDPIYAIFNLKSSEYLKFKKINTDTANMQVKLELADGSIYPHTGTVEFVNNTVDKSAGTISLRATFANKEGLLVPGDFVKVVASGTVPHTVLLAPQTAVIDSVDGYYVWVVDKDSKAQQKFIKISDQVDKCWVVVEGLSEGDQIIATGIQKLKTGMVVKVNENQVNDAQGCEVSEVKDSENKEESEK